MIKNRELQPLTEPRLMFGFGQRTEDPRDGLCLFGPYETFSAYSIQAVNGRDSEGQLLTQVRSHVSLEL